MAGSLPLKNDVQLVTQLPQSRRQALDVLSAAESVPPISNSEVTCGPMTRPATLSGSATSSSNSTDFSSSSSSNFLRGLQLPSKPLRGLLPISLLGEQRHAECEQFA